MTTTIKIFLCSALFVAGINSSYAQTACCAKGSKEQMKCATADGDTKATASKACCAPSAKATTSGCTPSNCRGAKTKFGEAKVISELRLNLVALKAKMEKHEDHSFSAAAISVHDIIGASDEESLQIVAEQVSIIEPEILAVSSEQLPALTASDNKAIQVKHLRERITALTEMLH